MEVEAKFRVPDAALLDRLAAAPRLVGYDLEVPASREDSDVFLDTADRRLLAAGFYLRRRENADGVRIALKQIAAAEDDGVLRREEHELRAAADVPVVEWPRGPLRERLLDLIGQEALAPVLELGQARRTRRVGLDGRAVAELSLDVVETHAGSRLRRWFEVELELLPEGEEGDLAALATALREVWGLAPEPSSKFERALALSRDDAGAAAGEAPVVESVGAAPADAAPAAPVEEEVAGAVEPATGLEGELDVVAAAESEATSKSESETEPSVPEAEAEAVESPAVWKPDAAQARRKRPAVSRDDTMVEAAVAVMRLHYARMLAHEKGTLAGEDAEELHDMRVATRRLRMALRLFADYLDADAMRPVLKGLRRTGRALGAVRDLDVFREKTLRYVDGLPKSRQGELAPLFDAWEVEYETRRAEMTAYLESRRYTRFVERLGALLAGSPEALAAPGSRQGALVRQVLPALLHRDLADVLAGGSLVAGTGTSPARFHELRIACKALRYTLEFFEAPLGRGAKPLIEAMKTLQDHLGDLQDGVVSCGIVRDVLTWGSWAPSGQAPPSHTDIVVAPGLARYLAARQEEMETLVVMFPEVWPSVAGEEFGGRLAGLLARL